MMAAVANEKSIIYEMKIEQIVCLPIGIYISIDGAGSGAAVDAATSNFSTRATHTYTHTLM